MAGEEIWRFQGGADLSTDIIYGAAATSDGSFVVAGETFGSWTGVNAGDADFVVVKIDSEGKFLWAWQEGSSEEDEMRTVAALDDDSVVVAGYVNGTWRGEASLGLGDFAAVKFDSDGATLWSWREGSEEEDTINTAAVTADGNIVLAGQTQGDWNGTQVGFSDAAAVKLDANGTVLWRWQEGADGTDGVYIYASAARPDGSVVLAGYTYGSWHGELSPDAYTDFVAVALDEHGEELWRWQDGSDGVNRLRGATSLSDGSVVLAGYTEGDWSGSNQGKKDFAAVKLDVDGVEEWRWQNGTKEDDEWETAASDINGSITVGGYTEGSWGELNEGGQDFAAMSLDADGVVLWTYQGGTVGDDDINVATVTADGAVLLAGWTDGSWHIADSDSYPDFAAVLLGSGAAAPTPPPTPPEPVATPTPLPFFTSLPTASVAPSSDAIPTASPTAIGRGLSPTERTPGKPPQALVMTLTPMRTAHPTAIVAPFQSSAPSSTLVTSASSSGSSTGLNALLIGAAVGVAASLVVIGVCLLRHRKPTGTAAIPAPASHGHGRRPQAVPILPGPSVSVSSPLPPPPYAEPPPYDVARRA